jgi:hypothetical protein
MTMRWAPGWRVLGLAMLATFLDPGHAEATGRDVFPQPPFALGHYLHIPGVAFRPVDPVAVRLAPRGAGLICPLGAPFTFLDAWFSPPHGARLQSVQIHGRDNSGQHDQTLVLFRVCHRPTGTPPSAADTTLLGLSSTSGFNQGFMIGVNLPATEIVDAAQCRYLLRVSLTAEGVACQGEDMILDRALVAYEVLP